MFKAFQNKQDLANSMGKGIVSLPSNDKSIVLPDMSFDDYISLDYRVSNPRLLTADQENKITGNRFSQKQYSNYIVGMVKTKPFHVGFLRDSDLNYNDEKNVEEMVDILSASFREKLLKKISYSNINGIRGNVSAFVSNEVINPVEMESLYVKFAISTTVFYNSYRATIGNGNEIIQLDNILSSLSERIFNKDVMVLLSPEFSMGVDSWSNTFEEMKNVLDAGKDVVIEDESQFEDTQDGNFNDNSW